MNKAFTNILTLNGKHNTQRWVMLIFISFIYFLNFSINDIWTPNESFYAEAVREMFESGNFLDIKYNYEARYNKPPLTYWIMALSAGIFGLSEFSLRFPIILLGIGSIWLTYLLGKKMHGERAGIYSMALVAFTIQYLAVKQYASPEMPLTFFFTLTIYWFYVGFKESRSTYLILSYVALGLTTLTKGFPYIIVIGGIIGLYILLLGQFRWNRIWTDIKKLKLHIGIPLTLVIGLSWVIFMYLKDGEAFWDIYYTETFGRALSKESKSLKPFFYLEVLSWSVLPCTLAFIYAIVYYFRHKDLRKEVLLPTCWLIVMLVIFTISKGKLPTYMIQAHPAVVLIIVPILIKSPPRGLSKTFLSISFWIVSIGLIIINFYATHLFKLNVVFYLLPVVSTIFLIYLVFKSKAELAGKLTASVFWVGGFLAISFALFLPRLEKFRPYNEIGIAIRNNEQITSEIPIYIQGTLIHNIPYYAERKALRDATISEINESKGVTLALVRQEDIGELNPEFESLWTGLIYDFSSESQFAKLVMAVLKAEEGDLEKFAVFELVYRAQ